MPAAGADLIRKLKKHKWWNINVKIKVPLQQLLGELCSHPLSVSSLRRACEWELWAVVGLLFTCKHEHQRDPVLLYGACLCLLWNRGLLCFTTNKLGWGCVERVFETFENMCRHNSCGIQRLVGCGLVIVSSLRQSDWIYDYSFV